MAAAALFLSHTKAELTPPVPHTNTADHGAHWIATTMESGLTAVRNVFD